MRAERRTCVLAELLLSVIIHYNLYVVILPSCQKPPRVCKSEIRFSNTDDTVNCPVR